MEENLADAAAGLLESPTLAVADLVRLHGSGLPRPADAARRIAAAVLTGLTERAP